MYFRAESNGLNYEITVREGRKHWHVGIKPEDGEWRKHEIPRENYQSFDETITFIFENSSYLVDVLGEGTDYEVYTRGSFRSMKIFNDEMLLHESLRSGSNMAGGNELGSGMPGKIVKIFVSEGEEVKAGEPLLIMEAMKMENEMRADQDCKIKKIHVSEGENVEGGTSLISFE